MSADFISEAEIGCPDPRRLADALADYWIAFDVEVARTEDRIDARLGVGEARLEARGPHLHVRFACDELGALESLRGYFTEMLAGFPAAAGAKVAWRGNIAVGRTFSDFREVRLVRTVDLAPRLRRLTFAGEDVARFGSSADIHVRMYFPPDGVDAPEWPRPGPDGRTVWPAEGRRPDVRYYTVRRFDAAAGEIDVDFVMHDREGPGSAFAARAKPGAVCGMAGPLGRSVPQAAYTLLVGDETALPAIARILEEMPPEARGGALIEVESSADEMPLDRPSGVSLRWLHRRGAPAGATSLLADAVAAQSCGAEDDLFVWVACEYAASKTIRKFLRTAWRLPRERHLVVGYWAREEAEAEAA